MSRTGSSGRGGHQEFAYVVPSQRAARRALGRDRCEAEHPERKDGLGNALKCRRPKAHKNSHKARTRAGEVWW